MIKVVGIGPGHPDYLLPVARDYIERADYVIGGKRHLETMKVYIHGTPIVVDLSETGMQRQVQQALAHDHQLTVYLVSGDPMFYSLYAYIHRTVKGLDASQGLEAISGISSLQYMFNRIGMSYSNASFISLHGRECSLSEELQKVPVLGILTDRVHDIRWIAHAVKQAGYEQADFWLGERLSYDDECIRKLRSDETEGIEADPLSVVIVDVQR